MASVAGVYIIEAPYHIDRVYSYYIPHDIAERVVPGSVVEVPFGNGNRRMTAVVYETYDEADREDIKPIMSAVDVFPPYLTPELIRLCSFLKERTLCTFGEAVKCILPSAALSRIAEYYRAAPDFDESRVEKIIGTMNEKAAFVYAAVRSSKRISKETLRGRFGEETTQILLRLVREGLIEKCGEVKRGGSNIKTDLKIYPGGKFEEIGEKPLETVFKSERQRLVMSTVSEAPGILLSDVADALQLDRQIVRTAAMALEKKGYVRTESESVWRTPSVLGKDVPAYKTDFELSEEQQTAYERLLAVYRADAPRAALLHGVTGSGKTNVLLKLIDRVIEDKKSVIMLVPEIALTPQTVGRFAARYGSRIALVHSALSAGERFDEWRRIRSGEASVVIGTRSAVMAPVKDLGLIIIDEEHEHTYKSDTDPKYSAHEVASYRCGEAGSAMILASATPSVTSFYKAVTGKYTLAELKSRYGASSLPDTEICDMRAELSSGNTSPFSRALIGRIGHELDEGRQTILFLNRRGYNSQISCRSCGDTVKCPHCSVSLTYHVSSGAQIPREREAGEGYLEVRKNRGYLHCHMCGYREKVPDRCPECGGEHFMFTGCGTQLAEDELKKLYPNIRIIRMDHDTTNGKSSHEALLSDFREGKADILLGTQMVTKGHDFPNVTTVGVLNADSSLFLDDYRANERTFSMLTQVIGRAGRGSAGGKSVVQTFNPESDIIALAAKQDYRSFYEQEIRIRQALTFPPFCDIAVVTLASSDEGRLGSTAVRMGERIREYTRKEYTDVKAIIYGPFEAPVYKVQNVCRLRFVIKCRLNKRTREFISSLLCDFSKGGPKSRGASAVRVTADLNPSSI